VQGWPPSLQQQTERPVRRATIEHTLHPLPVTADIGGAILAYGSQI